MSDTTKLATVDALPSSNITDVGLAELGVCGITTDSAPEDVVRMLGTADVLKDRLSEIVRYAKERTQEWVETNGSLKFGPFVWCMGDVSDVECTDEPGAMHVLFELAGGDFETLIRDYLKKNPIKHGSAMNAMGEEVAAKFFRRVKVTELRDNVTKTKRELKKLDTRFVKQVK